MRWPGSEGENVSEMVLGGKVGPGSAEGQIGDAVKLSGVSFAELGISGAIESLGVLLSGLKLLKLRGKDAGGANRLIVIKKHDTSVDGLLEGSPRRVESILGSIIGNLNIRLVESGSKEAVVGNLNVSAGLGDGLPRDVYENSAGPVPYAGRARIRGFADPDGGEGRRMPTGA